MNFHNGFFFHFYPIKQIFVFIIIYIYFLTKFDRVSHFLQKHSILTISSHSDISFFIKNITLYFLTLSVWSSTVYIKHQYLILKNIYKPKKKTVLLFSTVEVIANICFLTKDVKALYFSQNDNSFFYISGILQLYISLIFF